MWTTPRPKTVKVSGDFGLKVKLGSNSCLKKVTLPSTTSKTTNLCKMTPCNTLANYIKINIKEYRTPEEWSKHCTR